MRAGAIRGTHRYITIRQLSSLHSARINAGTGALMVPMWAFGIGLVNLQTIYPDGRKRFMTGGRVKGAYSVMGSLNGAERVLICEGWATGATLFEMYSSPVVVVFDADHPVVCMDETTKQCTREVRALIRASRGQIERYDGEYQRMAVG